LIQIITGVSTLQNPVKLPDKTQALLIQNISTLNTLGFNFNADTVKGITMDPKEFRTVSLVALNRQLDARGEPRHYFRFIHLIAAAGTAWEISALDDVPSTMIGHEKQ